MDGHGPVLSPCLWSIVITVFRLLGKQLLPCRTDFILGVRYLVNMLLVETTFIPVKNNKYLPASKHDLTSHGFILSNKSHVLKCAELLNIAFVGWVTLSISRTVEEIGGCIASWGPVYPWDLSFCSSQLGVNFPVSFKAVQNAENGETNVPAHTLLLFADEPAWCFSLQSAGWQQHEACVVLTIIPPPPSRYFLDKRSFFQFTSPLTISSS